MIAGVAQRENRRGDYCSYQNKPAMRWESTMGQQYPDDNRPYHTKVVYTYGEALHITAMASVWLPEEFLK